MVYENQIALNREVRAAGIRVSEIARLSERSSVSSLRSYLNGFSRMPQDVEGIIRKLLAERSAPTTTDRGQA